MQVCQRADHTINFVAPHKPLLASSAKALMIKGENLGEMVCAVNLPSFFTLGEQAVNLVDGYDYILIKQISAHVMGK